MRKNKPQIPTLPEHIRKTCAIYGRVSTDKQAQKFSPQTQVDAMLSKAASKGLIVPPELRFMDTYSGKQESRPDLDRLREAVRQQKTGNVIIYTVDRMSRRVEHGALIAAEFKRYGVVLDFVEVPYDDTPSGRLMFNIMVAMAEFMGDMIVENSHRGSMARAEKGLWHCQEVPYGFVYVSEHASAEDREGAIGNFKIYEPHAKMLRQMFEWYRSGRYSFYGIAQRLNDEGVPSPRDGKWFGRVVSKMMENRALIGQAKGPEGMIIPCPVIIDRIIFEQVQKMRAASKESRCGRPPKDGKYLLSGMLWCRHCKNRMTARGPDRQRTPFYQCSNLDQTNHGKRRCNASPITQAQINPVIWDAVWTAITRSLWKLVKDYYERMNAAPKEDARRSLARKIQRFEAEQKRAKENMQNPRFSLSEANAAYDAATGKLQIAQAELGALVIELPPLPAKQEIELIERTIRENPPETWEEKRTTLKKAGVKVLYADHEAEISGAVSLDATYWDRRLTCDPNKAISIPFNLKVRVA